MVLESLSELAERNLRIARAAIVDGELIRANNVLSDFVYPEGYQKEVAELLGLVERMFYSEQLPLIKAKLDRNRFAMLFELANARRFVNFAAKNANLLSLGYYTEIRRNVDEQFAKVVGYAKRANEDVPEELTSLERRFNYFLNSHRHAR